MKLTRKQVEKIIKDNYKDTNFNDELESLCFGSPHRIRRQWCNYWCDISSHLCFSSIHNFFYWGEQDSYTRNYQDVIAHTNLTRLLTLHIFVREKYK